MKQFTFAAMLSIAVLALVAWLSPSRIADDETDDTKIKTVVDHGIPGDQLAYLLDFP